MRQVYLDNNATTPVDPHVLDAMVPFFAEGYGNAASIHSLGQKARAAVEEARLKVAGLIGAHPAEVIFTSGGTESDNTAVRGAAYQLRDRGNHIITSTIEHPAVLRTCEQLEEEGFQVTYVAVGRDGCLDPEQVRAAIRDETILISVMHANNETGSLQPLPEIVELAGARGITVHTDAVQTVGKLPIDVTRLKVDMLSLSAHKFHGPKGVGALFVRKGVDLKPFLLGGSHERGRRAGTENVPGIVGLGKACQRAGEFLEDFDTRVRSLRDSLEKNLIERVPDVEVNGTCDQRMPHVSNLSFRFLEGEALLIAMDFQGIAVSTGAACSSGALEPSHVLRAMKLERDRTQSAIRFSLSRLNTRDDIDFVLEVVPPMITRMREIAVGH